MTLTTTLATLPDERAALDPTAACIDDDRLALTNAGFLARVEATAAMLRAAGIGPGDVIATTLTNRVEMVVVMFATWRIGAALTPINPSLTAGEAAFQVEDSGARLLVHEGTALDLPGLTTVEVTTLPATPVGGDSVVESAPDALALLIYTSGTTGKPKGVMLDHANLTAMVGMITEALHVTAADHCLLILPLFHVNGILVSVLSPLAAGGCTTVTGRFSPTTFFDTVEAVRPTYFSAVPAIYAMLSALPDDVDPDLSSVRFAICGAAPMPAELIGRFEQRYGLTIVEGYGLSECTCAATINPIDGRRKAGTVGLPLPGQEVALLDNDGRPTTEGPGEVIVRGPNVMRGYLNKPEDTASSLKDGWLHTGDVGYFDVDGYLVLVDRVKDMIIRGGENIYPKEIENLLYSHPAVLEAAVVGRPHAILGEEPVAFVALRNPGSVMPVELVELCSTSLARFKVPGDVVILDVLPKNALGKIAKPELRPLLATG